MAILTITESCPVHVAHGGNIPLNCFDEATGAVLSILTDAAPVEDIVSLTRTWIDQEGNDTAALEFMSYDGSEIFVTFSA
jgi:hypothetical protein